MPKNKKEQEFCVIGLGAYGFSLAKTLAEKGAYVLAVDTDMERVEAIKNYASEAVQFDATDPIQLEEHGVTQADVVIVAIGELFEPVVLICMELLKANVKRIIARANNDTQEAILKRIGIKEVIHPEKDEGERMATALMRSSISDYFELSEDVAIYEISAPEDMIGFTLSELKLRQRYNVNLLTIKRPRKKIQGDELPEAIDYNVLGVLDPNTRIQKSDRMVIMGTHETINKLIDTN